MKKVFILAAVAVMAILGAGTNAQAQGIVIPPGTSIVCTLECHGLIFIRLSDGSVIEMPANARGQAELESVASNEGTKTAPASSTLVPKSITVAGNDPSLGNFSFNFDASRAVNPTVVTANQNGAGNYFPATCYVYANVTGTIDAFPGTFTNTTECRMKTVNLGSFNPQDGEVYEFTDDVEFRNDDSADGVSFVIPAGATVILH
jgi:hypothetical protein